MNIEYPISEILKCVEIINQPKKKFDRNSDKTFNLNNTVSMKKKITKNKKSVTHCYCPMKLPNNPHIKK